MRRMTADEILALCAIAGASVYLYADALLPEMSQSGPFGPRVFPALVGIGVLLSGIMLAKECRDKRRLAIDFLPVDPAVLAETRRRRRMLGRILVAMLAWISLYYFCFESVGYVIATVVFLLGLLSYFHRGHPVANLVIAGSFTLIVDLVFSHLLNVPMPVGLLSI